MKQSKSRPAWCLEALYPDGWGRWDPHQSYTSRRVAQERAKAFAGCWDLEFRVVRAD